jgi:hypothetical protein
LFPHEGSSVVDQKASGIENYEDFCKQGLNVRLPCLAGNQSGDCALLFLENSLEFPEDSDALSDINPSPGRLRGARSSDGVLNVGLRCTVPLAQNLARCGIDRL